MGGLNLTATIGLDGSQFERGMRRVGETAASSIKSLVVGAVGVYTLEAALSKTVETADELVTTSKRLGLGIEQLQILRQAAKDNNVEFSALASTFEKLDIARAKALGGGADSQKFLKSFQSLGVSREMLLSQTAASLFTGPIASTVGQNNPEQLAMPLRDILGKSFGPEIAVLTTDFQELGDRMKRMGAIMDSTTAVELKKFKEEMSLIGQIITSQLAPGLILFAKVMFTLVTEVQAAAAFLGGLTATKTSLKDWLLFWTLGPTKQDLKLGSKRADEVFGDAADRLSELEEAAKASANKLNNPSAANFEGEQGALKERTKAKQISDDSLTKVGNFLGTSKSAIGSAQEKMAIHAEQTAANTGQALKVLGSILGAIVGKQNAKTIEQFGETFFPLM